MNKKIIIVLLLAFFLRFYSFPSIPFGFTPDEASFGYDAYSLLKTGKDQWGHSWPLVLESFGDFKSPLYTYLTIPFIAVLGLTKLAVRLPNAILGTAAVYITYLLVLEIVKKGLTRTEKRIKASTVALIASFLLAISPWHIMMTRGAFEANLTTFFLPLGIYLFLIGLKNHKYLAVSFLIFGLNLFTYHSAKLVTPVVATSLIAVFIHELREIEKRTLLLPFLIFFIFLLFSFYTFLQGAATRALDVNVFKGSLEASSGERLNDILSGMPEGVARILHNKYQVGADRFTANYFQYFSPQFLFTHGPAEGTYGMIPGRGVLVWFELPILLGTFIFLFSKKVNKALIPILVWLLVAPVPAALTSGRGYAGNRSVIMLPAIQILLAFGLVQIVDIFKNWNLKRYNRIIVSLYLILSFLSYLFFIDDYYIQSPYKTAKDMLYGNLEAAYWLKQTVGENGQAVVGKSLSEPQIYIAFAYKWDPVSYQKESKNWNYKDFKIGFVDQMPEYKLGNYIFKSIEWRNSDKGSYLVGKPEEFPEDYSITNAIYYPNGEPAIVIVGPEGNLYAQKI